MRWATSQSIRQGQKLANHLRRSLGFQVDGSARRRAEYASDASSYRVYPQAVAFPRHEEDVQALVAECVAQGVPLTPRGGGTSVAGNAIGPGVVVDFSRHMNKVIAIEPTEMRAVVQPGLVLSDLQFAAAPFGLRFGPDPSSHDRCTLGGMIGNDACGSRALGYGRTSDNVQALRLIDQTAEVLELVHGQPTPNRHAQGISRLVNQYQDDISNSLARFGRQLSGYELAWLLPENGSSLARALVGSEGTCGVVTQATVRLVQSPRSVILVVLGFRSITDAARATLDILDHGAIAIEGIDSRIVNAVQQSKGLSYSLPEGDAWLFVEVGGEDEAEAHAAALRVVDVSGATDSYVIREMRDQRAAWALREGLAGVAGRAPSGAKGYAGWEDSAVPVEHLADYLQDLDKLLDQHKLTSYPYGHFGDGCVHMRIDFPLHEQSGTERMRAFVEDAARLVVSYGGSLSGEHGDGRARSELLEIMYPKELLDAFRAFKALFDSNSVFNPGVIVDPVPLSSDLRSTRVHIRSKSGYQFDGGFEHAVGMCTGIGKCRASVSPDGVMCPSYLVTHDEKDSTRGRARVLQAMVEGDFLKGGWRSKEVADALALCIGCKACSSECPAGVDMTVLKSEVLYQMYEHRLRPRSHFSLGRLPQVLRVAGKMPGLSNRLMSWKSTAAVAKWLGGIDQQRELPPLAPHSFWDWWGKSGRDGIEPDPGDEAVVLWVDTFSNFFSPNVAKAAVRVLEHLGYRVLAPRFDDCCGLTYISTGQLKQAKKALRWAVEGLGSYLARGYRVVVIEPSCMATLKDDAGRLLGRSPEVLALSQAVTSLTEFVAPALLDLELDLGGQEIVAQPHCHTRATIGWSKEADVLRSAGAQVTVVPGCCGLAGNFGYENGNFEISAAIGELELGPALRSSGGNSMVVADGFSCRLQIEQLHDRSARHLIEVIDSLLPDSELAGRK